MKTLPPGTPPSGRSGPARFSRSRKPALTGRIPPPGGASFDEKPSKPQIALFPNHEGRINFDVSWIYPDGPCAISVNGYLAETDEPLSTIRQTAEKGAEFLLKALAVSFK